MLLPPVLKLWLPLRFVVPCDAEEEDVEDPPPTTTQEGLVVVGFIDGIVLPNANGLIGLPSRRDLLLRNLSKRNCVDISWGMHFLNLI